MLYTFLLIALKTPILHVPMTFVLLIFFFVSERRVRLVANGSTGSSSRFIDQNTENVTKERFFN